MCSLQRMYHCTRDDTSFTSQKSPKTKGRYTLEQWYNGTPGGGLNRCPIPFTLVPGGFPSLPLNTTFRPPGTRDMGKPLGVRLNAPKAPGASQPDGSTRCEPGLEVAVWVNQALPFFLGSPRTDGRSSANGMPSYWRNVWSSSLKTFGLVWPNEDTK